METCEANLRKREALLQQADIKESMGHFRLVVLKSLNICDGVKLQGKKIHIVLVNSGFVRAFSWIT